MVIHAKNEKLVQISIRSGNNQADINSRAAGVKLVQTEANLALSNPMLGEVASRYPVLTIDQLAKDVDTN